MPANCRGLLCYKHRNYNLKGFNLIYMFIHIFIDRREDSRLKPNLKWQLKEILIDGNTTYFLITIYFLIILKHIENPSYDMPMILECEVYEKIFKSLHEILCISPAPAPKYTLTHIHLTGNPHMIINEKLISSSDNCELFINELILN